MESHTISIRKWLNTKYMAKKKERWEAKIKKTARKGTYQEWETHTHKINNIISIEEKDLVETKFQTFFM